jgi:hypothetical protein
MADLGGITPVGLQAQTPDTFGTLNNILGIQGKRQQLAIQAQDLQQKQIETQTAQGASQFFSSFNPLDYVASDGTTDMDKVHASAGYKNASALARPAIDAKLQSITSAQVKNKSDMMQLGNQGLATMGSAVGKLATDQDVLDGNEKGRTKVDQTLSDLEAQFPGAKSQIDLMRAHVKGLDLTKNAKDLSRSVFQAQLQGQDAAKQLEITKPGGATITNEQGNTQVVNTNPYAAFEVGSNVGAPMKTGVGPQVQSSPAGPLATVKGGTIKALEDVGPPTPGAPGGINPTHAQQTVTTGRAEGINSRVQQAQGQANNTVLAQDALTRAKALLESPNAPRTGENYESVKKLKNTLAQLGVDPGSTEDMNTLTKNLARFEAQRATAAGLGNTDAARELAHAGSPSTQLDNKALLGIVRQSLASEQALASYANVQSKTKDVDGQIKNENDFRNISNHIEAREYGMMRNKDEAEKYRKAHGLSVNDLIKARAAIKDFDSR